MTLQDAPGRSGTLQGRFGGHSGGLCGHFGDGWMMLMMVVAMVMAMAKIFAFRFYISKLPINRLRGRYVIIEMLCEGLGSILQRFGGFREDFGRV